MEPSPKPVMEPSPRPVMEPSPRPVMEPSPKPVMEPSSKPVIDLSPKPVMEPSPKPVMESSPKPVMDIKTNTYPTQKPVQGLIIESVSDSTHESISGYNSLEPSFLHTHKPISKLDLNKTIIKKDFDGPGILRHGLTLMCIGIILLIGIRVNYSYMKKRRESTYDKVMPSLLIENL